MRVLVNDFVLISTVFSKFVLVFKKNKKLVITIDSTGSLK